MNAVARALENAPAGQADYTEYLASVLNGVEEIGDPSELFRCAFRFFENHCTADLGTPGPLVHFVERFYPQYLEDLCVSVKRRPTMYTVWMLNRILNGHVPIATRERLIDLLRSVVDNPTTDAVVRDQSRQFLDRHA